MYFSESQVRSWPKDEYGWHKDPATGTRIFIGEFARIGESASIGESARIGESAVFEVSPFYFIGARDTGNVSAPGHIAIGCHDHSISWWRKNGEALAAAEGYSTRDIEEYHLIFETCVSWMKLHGMENEVVNEKVATEEALAAK